MMSIKIAFQRSGKMIPIAHLPKEGHVGEKPREHESNLGAETELWFLWLFLFLHPSSRQSLQAKITYIVKSWHCFQVCDNLNFHNKKGGLSHFRSSKQKNLWKISRNSDRETVSVEWLSSWCVAVKMSTTPSTQAGSGRHCWDKTGSVQRTGLAIHLCNV